MFVQIIEVSVFGNFDSKRPKTPFSERDGILRYSSTMLSITEHRWLKTGSSLSRLGFEFDGGSRYLLLDGKRAYSLGFAGCQTCSFLFERLGGANQALQVDATAEALREGVDSLDDSVVSLVGLGLPEGEYGVVLAEAPVVQVKPGATNDYFTNEQPALWGEDNFWCLPHDPRVSYFRAGDKDIGEGRRLFNFVVPMFPTKWLRMATVAEYAESLRTKASGTAVSVAVLDIRSPADWTGEQTPDPVEHWCLTHFLLDGHHKLNAAAEAGKPLRLLTFIATSLGVSKKEDIESAIRLLSTSR